MVTMYILNDVAMPTVIAVADAEMKSKALEIINKEILKEFSKQFNYDDVIHAEKDNSGNITMIKADTLKLNKIACDVAVNSQEKLNSIGTKGIKIPMGYIFKNNILAYLGPNITVKMEPIGSIEAKYISNFESAGINQTRHRIYVKVITDIKVIAPFKNSSITVSNEVPIAETIIVGKIPETSISLDLNSAGLKLSNSGILQK